MAKKKKRNEIKKGEEVIRGTGREKKNFFIIKLFLFDDVFF